jgi:hypothetical protein
MATAIPIRCEYGSISLRICWTGGSVLPDILCYLDVQVQKIDEDEDGTTLD